MKVIPERKYIIQYKKETDTRHTQIIAGKVTMHNQMDTKVAKIIIKDDQDLLTHTGEIEEDDQEARADITANRASHRETVNVTIVEYTATL